MPPDISALKIIPSVVQPKMRLSDPRSIPFINLSVVCVISCVMESSDRIIRKIVPLKSLYKYVVPYILAAVVGT